MKNRFNAENFFVSSAEIDEINRQNEEKFRRWMEENPVPPSDEEEIGEPQESLLTEDESDAAESGEIPEFAETEDYEAEDIYVRQAGECEAPSEEADLSGSEDIETADPAAEQMTGDAEPSDITEQQEIEYTEPADIAEQQGIEYTETSAITEQQEIEFAESADESPEYASPASQPELEETEPSDAAGQPEPEDFEPAGIAAENVTRNAEPADAGEQAAGNTEPTGAGEQAARDAESADAAEQQVTEDTVTAGASVRQTNTVAAPTIRVNKREIEKLMKADEVQNREEYASKPVNRDLTPAEESQKPAGSSHMANKDNITQDKKTDRNNAKKKDAAHKPKHLKDSKKEKKEKKEKKQKKDRKTSLSDPNAYLQNTAASAAKAGSAAAAVQHARDTKPEGSDKAGKKAPKKKRKKRRSFSKNAVIIIILLILLIAAGFYYLVIYNSEPDISYVSGTSPEIEAFTPDKDNGGKLAPAGSVTRGTEVLLKKKIKEDDVTYYMIGKDEDEKDLYVSENNLSATADGVVAEKEVWVRTPATIYAEAEGPAIASFASKGTCLRVKGYDRLQSDGCVHKYEVEYAEENDSSDSGESGEDASAGASQSGYVYGKYMTDSEESASAPYNENGETDKAAKDKYGFDLYGGNGENLDWYPYKRTKIKGNEFCSDARAMYINSYAAVNPDAWLKVIKDTDCNSVVIDIKDGPLTYQSEVAKELSPTSYKNAYVTAEELKKGVQAYQDAGLYTIGRIVVFNDSYYASDHPENCIKYGGSAGWPSAFSRDVWEYNVRLAEEAAELFGFNEIQFDYVRFPEATYEMSKSGNADFRNKYDEEKAQAIQNFCFYAADQLREAGVYISVDVFGESVYGYVTAYGQYWPAIANIVDAVSAMPYTDHTGGDGAWTQPYKTVYNWAKKAQKCQKRLQDPAAARTWITGYNTPYWAPTEHYGAKELKAQADALKDAGLEGGFIPWNALSDLDRYSEYRSVWNK